jgi:hypothetical protein
MIGPIMIRMGPILEEQLQRERNYSLFKVIPYISFFPSKPEQSEKEGPERKDLTLSPNW